MYIVYVYHCLAANFMCKYKCMYLKHDLLSIAKFNQETCISCQDISQ